MTIELIMGDCIEQMKSIKSKSVAMTCADLPFKSTKNSWEALIDLDAFWAHMSRIMQPHGAIVLFAVQPFTTKLITSNPTGYRHKWVWNKGQAGNFAVAKHMPLTVDEDILVFSARGERVNYYPIMRKGKLRMKGGKASKKNGRGFGGLKNITYLSDEYFPTSILNFPGVPRTQRLHSAQKPVPLLEYLITSYSEKADTVLDCTMGSGSAMVACQGLERNGIGIEKDPTIYQIATDRLAMSTQNEVV